MKKVLFLALIFAATLASCKNNTATTENTTEVDTTTVISVDTTAVENDSLQVDPSIQPAEITGGNESIPAVK